VARSRLGIGEAEFLEFPDPCLVLFINQCFTSNMNLVTSFVGRLFDAFMLLRTGPCYFYDKKTRKYVEEAIWICSRDFSVSLARAISSPKKWLLGRR
jgi:hypothetical protein